LENANRSPKQIIERPLFSLDFFHVAFFVNGLSAFIGLARFNVYTLPAD